MFEYFSKQSYSFLDANYSPGLATKNCPNIFLRCVIELLGADETHSLITLTY